MVSNDFLRTRISVAGWGNMPQKKIKHTTEGVRWVKANAMTERNGANDLGGLQCDEQSRMCKGNVAW